MGKSARGRVVKLDSDNQARKLLRCAIYTRKSTEHNLDLEFNSLDAQREACEAYIKSQAHEGWRLIHDHYDDGAFSGASLDRPALQKLLNEVRAGKIDIIVVYKVDRLTRSLADFAKLVELFDQHSVSFVSVTQSFNTTSSMGRLTLNVLLSFAQFEREVIGERVRDKIAASKAKGIWVGGSVPLGYASVKKKLVVVPEEAETVRLIFRRYLELGSIRNLAEDLDRKRIRTRRHILSTGKVRGGIRFGVGSLGQLLRNRFYVGEIAYRGAVHVGEHKPILDHALFDAVQAKLAASANARQLKLKASPAILAGRIFDDQGNRMTPAHTNKKGARYRYYVSHPILQNRRHDAGTLTRVSAPELETLVVKAVRDHLDNTDHCSGLAPDRQLIDQHVGRITLKSNAIEIRLTCAGGLSADEQDQYVAVRHPSDSAVFITVPWTRTATVATKGVLHSPSPGPARRVNNPDVLLAAIAKARAWIDDIVEGRVASFAEIAKRGGKVERHIRLLAPLAFVSPKIVKNIADGAILSITVTDFAKRMDYSWMKQAI
jgi:DNA invertase Pin-like site-specific DNA recombinase